MQDVVMNGNWKNLDKMVRDGENQIRREKEQEENNLQEYFDNRERKRVSKLKISEASWQDVNSINDIREAKNKHSGYTIRKEDVDQDWMDQVLTLVEQIQPRLEGRPEIVQPFNEMLKLLDQYSKNQEDDNSAPELEVLDKKFKKSDVKILKSQINKELKNRESPYYGMKRCELQKKVKEIDEELDRRKFLESIKDEKGDENLTEPSIDNELEDVSDQIARGKSKPKDKKLLENMKENAKKFSNKEDIAKKLEIGFTQDIPAFGIKKDQSVYINSDGSWTK